MKTKYNEGKQNMMKENKENLLLSEQPLKHG